MARDSLDASHTGADAYILNRWATHDPFTTVPSSVELGNSSGGNGFEFSTLCQPAADIQGFRRWSCIFGRWLLQYLMNYFLA